MQGQELTGATYEAFVREHKLMGARCKNCDALYLPPRPVWTVTEGDTEYRTDQEDEP